MVKIESINGCVTATIKRGNTETPVFKGQLLHMHDIETLKVVGGSLEYSIDELELVTVEGLPVITNNTTVVNALATSSDTGPVITAEPAKTTEATVTIDATDKDNG